jgi:No apical meristem (NAM) protein
VCEFEIKQIICYSLLEFRHLIRYCHACISFSDIFLFLICLILEKCILPAINGSWYFFTQKIPEESESKTVRPAKDGYWQKRITQLYLDIKKDGRVIGSKRGFSFYIGVQGKRFTAVATSWVMDEYSIYQKNVECNDVSPELKVIIIYIFLFV